MRMLWMLMFFSFTVFGAADVNAGVTFDECFMVHFSPAGKQIFCSSPSRSNSDVIFRLMEKLGADGGVIAFPDGAPGHNDHAYYLTRKRDFSEPNPFYRVEPMDPKYVASLLPGGGAGKTSKPSSTNSTSTGSTVDATGGSKNAPKQAKPVNKCVDLVTTSNTTYPHSLVNKCSFPIQVSYCGGDFTCKCKNPAKPTGECQADIKAGESAIVILAKGQGINYSGKVSADYAACRSDIKKGWVTAKLKNGKALCTLSYTE